MNKTERLIIKVLPDQKAALEAMAETEGEPVAVVLRRLIRAEAQRRGHMSSLSAMIPKNGAGVIATSAQERRYE